MTNLITDLAGKQGTITLTTTGTSGAATLIGNTLNIPQYTGGGGGSVTSVSVITGNGISGSVATATTTPAITLTLGAITPTSIVSSGNHQALRIGINQANSGTAMLEILNNGSLQGFRIENNLVTNIGFSTFVTGDAQVRFTALAGGILQW